MSNKNSNKRYLPVPNPNAQAATSYSRPSAKAQQDEAQQVGATRENAASASSSNQKDLKSRRTNNVPQSGQLMKLNSIGQLGSMASSVATALLVKNTPLEHKNLRSKFATWTRVQLIELLVSRGVELRREQTLPYTSLRDLADEVILRSSFRRISCVNFFKFP